MTCIILYIVIGIIIATIGEYIIGKDSDGTFGIIALIGYPGLIIIAIGYFIFNIPFLILKLIKKIENKNKQLK